MKWSKCLCGMLAAALLLPTAAASFKDAERHWAASSIDRWNGYGVVSGYSDGRFGPDDSITRGQMAVMLDRIFGWKETTQNPFRDMTGSEWYASAVLRANAAGVMAGDGNGNARPGSPITRQEAAVMLSRALTLKSDGRGKPFYDDDQIGAWARDAVDIMSSLGIIGGTPEGNFAPSRSITRAETTVILDRAIPAYYTRAGVYTDHVDGILAMVAAPGVTLKDMKFMGDLLIVPGAEGSEVTLQNVAVTGCVRILSGKGAKVLASGSSVLTNVEMAGNNARLVLDDKAKIESLSISGTGAHAQGLPPGLKVTVAPGTKYVKVNGHDVLSGEEITAGEDISDPLDDVDIEIETGNGGGSGGRPADPVPPAESEPPEDGETSGGNRDADGNIIIDFDDLMNGT
ncbi:MAG: S-layer homology domain-containing protein [Eubacteriales bacterium]|nr:S-layer homology domain-containing protein [Eubacteriales bacterium]